MGIKYQNNSLSFTIPTEEIIGVIGDGKEIIENLIHNDSNKKVSISKENLDEVNYILTVKERLQEEIRRKHIQVKNQNKKIRDSLRVVNLPTDLLERDIKTLSSSEKKLLELAISLLSNPEILIMEEPFKYLDYKKEKEMVRLLQKIKEQYQKTIVFISEDCETLYRNTGYIIIMKKENILLSGKTKDVYSKVDLLKKNKINIPQIVEFTSKVKKNKNIHIDYHTDIRDIIKDIYKHV